MELLMISLEEDEMKTFILWVTNETSAALGNIGGKHFSRKYFSRGEKNEHGSQIGGHGAIIKFQWLK